jgi:hypothetical protein
MMKHLCSILALALSAVAWIGGQSASAQAAYTKVQEVNFESATQKTIPVGWTVYFNTTEVRESGSSQTQGARLLDKTFSNSPYKQFFFLYSSTGNTETSAIYGDVEGYELKLPKGAVKISIPALLWKESGTNTIRAALYLYNEETKTWSTDSVASVTQKLTNSAQGSETTAITTEEVVLRYHNTTADRKALLRLTATNSGGETQILIGGFIVYNDPALVFEETFSDVADNYSPAQGRGWTIHVCTETQEPLTDGSGNTIKKSDGATDSTYTKHTDTVREKNISLSGQGSRVFKLTGTTNLPSAMYHQSYSFDENIYETYGESAQNETPLSLEAGKYNISLYAAAWHGSAYLQFSIIDNNSGAEVFSRQSNLTTNTYADRATAVTPDHIQYSAYLPAGNYMLKFTASERIVYGDITISQDQSGDVHENFNGVKDNYTPNASGWIFYTDNGTAKDQGKNYSGNGNRVFQLTNTTNLTGVAYLGNSSAATFGENGELTLEAGTTYLISYYAASWKESSNGTLFCYLNDEKLRQDALASTKKSDKAATLTSPDFIEFTYTPATTGTYVLKFSSWGESLVGNISIVKAQDTLYEMTLDANVGVGTLYLDQAVAIPAGVTAYTGALSQDEDGAQVLTLTRLTDGYIPAKTAVILEGTPGAALKFTAPTGSATAFSGENDLKGSNQGSNKASGYIYYTLGYKTTEGATQLGFYKNSALALRANRAYLQIENATDAASAPKIRIRYSSDTEEPGNITAIEQIEREASAQQTIYDPRGRRLQEIAQPGLYIVNGRKVLIR